MKINDTTRTFPRSEADAFGDNHYDLERQQRWEWMEGHQSNTSQQAEFWTYITLAFAAGFLVCHLFA
jgi:hypothetical protein